MGLRRPTQDELEAVCRQLGLSEFDTATAVAPHDRPVLTTVGDIRWLVLRTARYEDRSERVHLGELSVVHTDDLVLTIRYGQASPLTDLRASLESDPDLLRCGAPLVVAAIVTQVVDDYGPALDGLEHDVLEAENAVVDSRVQPPVRRLYLLKRQILQMLMVGDAAHGPLHRLQHGATALTGPAYDELQVALDNLQHVVQRARTLSDLVTTAIEVNLTQVSLHQNEDMRRISAWVAIAAVPTTVAGLYGMNFEHMPELRWSFGYPVTLAVVGLACSLLYRSFRRSGWL